VQLRFGAGFIGRHDPDVAAGTGWSVAVPVRTAGLGRHGGGMQCAGQGMATVG
jgi:hypothetical protein